MASTRGVDDLPRDLVGDFPPYVREAFHRYRRSSAAVRLYRRRGWNPVAVLYARDRDARDLEDALARFEHDELNPPLF